MKVRVCKDKNQYYVEYRKWLLWWAYEEDNGYGNDDTRYFASKETAITFARILAKGSKIKIPRHGVVWELE